jgi:endogenous inhibitor of DNA gyrase (YacG/DUF329 family)
MCADKSPDCAICGKPMSHKYKPFCSSRCATIDLGRWLGGGYIVPANDQDTEEDTVSQPSSDKED